jgi:hypothetical protein
MYKARESLFSGCAGSAVQDLVGIDVHKVLKLLKATGVLIVVG